MADIASRVSARAALTPQVSEAPSGARVDSLQGRKASSETAPSARLPQGRVQSRDSFTVRFRKGEVKISANQRSNPNQQSNQYKAQVRSRESFTVHFRKDEEKISTSQQSNPYKGRARAGTNSESRLQTMKNAFNTLKTFARRIKNRAGVVQSSPAKNPRTNSVKDGYQRLQYRDSMPNYQERVGWLKHPMFDHTRSMYQDGRRDVEAILGHNAEQGTKHLPVEHQQQLDRAFRMMDLAILGYKLHGELARR